MKGKSKLLKRISAWVLCLVVAIATMNLPVFTMEVKAARNIIFTYDDPSTHIQYDLYDDDTAEVGVFGPVYKYSGDIIIPDTITYSLNTYTVTGISSSAFYGCSGVTSINLPSTLERIGNEAFYGCNHIESITIPSGVTDIGEGAFQGCSSLTSITIPSGVTVIQRNTFVQCTNLQSISLSEGLTTIDAHAFDKCNSLRSIEIPASVTSLGSDSFKLCTNLNEVKFNGTTPPSWAGSGIEANATRIIVPDGCKDAYENAGFPVSKIFDNSSPGGGGGSSNNPSNSPSNHHSSSTNTTETLHTHNLSWVTVSEPTVQSKGVIELRCTTCGHVADTHFVGNDAVVYESYANNLEEQLRTVTPGEDVLLELGEWHSVPSYMMERIISSNVDVELTYSYKGVDYDIVIPAGKGIDMHIPWYGPLLMYSIYG